MERAVSLGLPVLPLRIQDVLPAGSLDYFIGSVHWLDALTPPLDAHLEHLADSVQHLLGQPVVQRIPQPVGRQSNVLPIALAALRWVGKPSTSLGKKLLWTR